jgi:hypothetical protein
LLLMFWGSSLPSSSGLSKNCLKMEAANSFWKSLITDLQGFIATRLRISGTNLVSQLIRYNKVFASMPDYNLSYREINDRGRGQIMFHPPVSSVRFTKLQIFHTKQKWNIFHTQASHFNIKYSLQLTKCCYITHEPNNDYTIFYYI